METNKKTPVAIALTILIFLIVLVFIGKQFSRKSDDKPEVKLKKSATLYLSEVASQSDATEKPVEIVVAKNDLEVTAVSVLVTYKYEGIEPLIPEDAVSQTKDVQIKPNQDLINSGWVYIINKVDVDEIDKTVKVKLALAYLATEGYRMEKDVVLGTISFAKEKIGKQIGLSMVTSETMMTTKGNEEVELKLDGVSVNP